MLMLALELLRWWYGPGLLGLIKGIGTRLRRLGLEFSVPLLLQTLFSPWRQIVSYGGRSLSDRLRSVLDNTISRLVGAVVRLLVIAAAGIIMLVTAVGGAALAVAWPFLPLIAIGLMLRGLLPW
jgi:hypothetical protein